MPVELKQIRDVELFVIQLKVHTAMRREAAQRSRSDQAGRDSGTGRARSSGLKDWLRCNIGLVRLAGKFPTFQKYPPLASPTFKLGLFIVKNRARLLYCQGSNSG
jgi:hypothetical protein